MQAINQKPHPWTLLSNPYRLFRSRPVFMVPAQIKMNQLAQIILKSKASLRSKHDTGRAIEELTVRDVYESLNSNLAQS